MFADAPTIAFLNGIMVASATALDLKLFFPVWDESDSELRGVRSKVLQYELHRLFANLKAHNEILKRGR